MAASMVAFVLPLGPGLWASRIAVLLATVPVGLLSLFKSVRCRDRAAILLVAFVAWAAVSAALSSAPGLAYLGSVRRNTSVIIYLGAACVWSIGTRVSRRGQDAVAWAVVGATFFSGVFAVVEIAAQTGSGSFGLSEGRPSGLALHPVYFGGFAAACSGWFAYRLSQRSNRGDVIGLTVSAVLAGLSGSRVALLAVILLTVFAAVRSRRVRTAWLMLAVGGGAALATVIHRALGSSDSTLDRPNASGLGDRFEIWSYAVHAWRAHPITGWGPGRFTPAAGPHVSDSWAARFSHNWADAHNVPLEWLATMGAVGLLLGIGFVVVAGRRARGPMAWMAAGIALGWLVEPVTAGTLGLAALLLGASVSTGAAEPLSGNTSVVGRQSE